MAEKKLNTGIVTLTHKNKKTGEVSVVDYKTVAVRVQEFRHLHPNTPLTTEIIHWDDKSVIMKATISDTQGYPLATGHAEEYRGQGMINATSALENAETSAIGRCLSAFGFGGQEYASQNEREIAINAQLDMTVKALEADDVWMIASLFFGQEQEAQTNIFSRLNTKQKSKCREVQQEASAKVEEYAELIRSSRVTDDVLAIQQLWEELPRIGKTLVWERLDEDAREWVRRSV